MIDLERPRLEEFRRWLVQEIPCEPQSVRTDLEALSLSSLAIKYMNWRDRFVPTRARNVTTWDGFLRDPRRLAFRPTIDALAQRITSGQDLTPFLSTEIVKCGYVRPKTRKDGKRRGIEWDDKDYALNGYGVHHLHLSDEMMRDGWARRTDDLLFATFDRESAFFLMIGDHDSFHDGTLMRAAAKSRAASGPSMKAGPRPYPTMSVADRNRLERHQNHYDGPRW